MLSDATFSLGMVEHVYFDRMFDSLRMNSVNWSGKGSNICHFHFIKKCQCDFMMGIN